MVNKSIFLSLLLIGVVAAFAGAGTWASFSDVETSSANTLTAGTLFLEDDALSTPMSVSDSFPGDSGKEKWTLVNGGTLSGELDIEISGYTETSPLITGVNGSDADADLLNNMVYSFGLDTTGDDAINIELASDDATALADHDWNAVVATMPSSASYDLIFDWSIPTTADNDIQGEGLSFVIAATIEQSNVD